MFFFKKKPLIFTSIISEEDNAILEYAPIIPAQKLIPDWWKNVPPGVFDWDIMKSSNTVKSCTGIINTIRSGLILPLWCDAAIKTDGSGWQFQYSDKRSVASPHPNSQAPGLYNDYFIIKLDSPWIIKCSEDNIKLHYSQPFYHFTSPTPYLIPPGIVSPSRKVYSTNIFMFVKKTESKLILEFNTPLIQILPLSDRKIQYKTEMVSLMEFERHSNIGSYTSVFFSKGLKRKNV